MHTPSTCGRPAGLRAAALWLAFFTTAVSGLVGGACGPEPASPDGAQAAAPTLPEATGTPGPLNGIWWAQSRESPYRALRMELLPTDDPDAWTGSWISFSWRSTESADALSGPSLPVAISARIERQELIITGPAPQFDASGSPNGDHGRWDLRLRLVSPLNKPAAYAGIMVHPEYTGPRGVAVKLTRTLESWTK